MVDLVRNRLGRSHADGAVHPRAIWFTNPARTTSRTSLESPHYAHTRFALRRSSEKLSAVEARREAWRQQAVLEDARCGVEGRDPEVGSMSEYGTDKQ